MTVADFESVELLKDALVKGQLFFLEPVKEHASKIDGEHIK